MYCDASNRKSLNSVKEKFPSCVQDSRYFNSLAELYSELNEEDVLCGLWKRRCSALETRAAVGWMQHGNLEVAQDALMQAMSKHANKAYETGKQDVLQASHLCFKGIGT